MSFRERYRKFRQWRHEPQHFEMSDTAHHCANCGQDFTGNYCPCCGQRGGVGAVTWESVRESVMELWGVGTRSMPYTLWNLLWRPGYLIGEYISGRRQVSFPPVKMLVFTAMIIFVLDHLFGINVFGPEDAETTIEAVGDGASTLTKFFTWLESHWDWATLLFFSLTILPTYIVFRYSPRHSQHTLPQGFFIQVFNSTLFLMLLFIWAIVRRIIMWGGDNDDVMMMGFFVIAISQVAVVYQQLFGFNLWGTLWRMVLLAVLTIVQLALLTIAMAVLTESTGSHSPWVYTLFGLFVAVFVAFNIQVFITIFTTRPATTQRQRCWQKVVMGLLWFGFVFNTLILLRTAYVVATGSIVPKDSPTMSDEAAVTATTVIPLFIVAFEGLLVYMIRRLRRKMQKDLSLLRVEHIDTAM